MSHDPILECGKDQSDCRNLYRNSGTVMLLSGGVPQYLVSNYSHMTRSTCKHLLAQEMVHQTIFPRERVGSIHETIRNHSVWALKVSTENFAVCLKDIKQVLMCLL